LEITSRKFYTEYDIPSVPVIAQLHPLNAFAFEGQKPALIDPCDKGCAVDSSGDDLITVFGKFFGLLEGIQVSEAVPGGNVVAEVRVICPGKKIGDIQLEMEGSAGPSQQDTLDSDRI